MLSKITSTRSLLFLALFCALTPIWITHREMWDGVAIEYAFEIRDLSGLLHAVTASGWLIAVWIYKTLWLLQNGLSIPYWLGIELLYTLALLGMAYEVMKLSSQRLGLSSIVGTIAVVLFLAHPIWHFLMSGIHVVHMTGLWFLLLGHRLTNQKSRNGQALGWILVTLSFQFPASIVMVFWLEALLFWQARKSQQQNATRAVLVALYAAAWYVSSRTVFAPTQTFGGYNQLLLPTSVEALRMIAWTGLKFVSWLGVLGAPVWAACIWTQHLKRKSNQLHGRQEDILSTTMTSTLGLVIAGCMLAIAPYWAVGKGPVVAMPYDWTARNALPLSVPLSLLMAILIDRLTPRSNTQKPHDHGNCLLMILVGCWLAMSVLGIGGKLYQIRLEKAVESSLRQIPAPPSGIVTIELPFDPIVRIRQNEANGLLWRAYSRAEWAVLVSPPTSWVQLIRDSYVGEQATAVKQMKDLPLWGKFMVMGDLKSFSCETTITLSLHDGKQGFKAWLNWLTWSSPIFNANLAKTTCP